ALHERNGVRFHLGTTVESFSNGAILLADGVQLEADIVLVGIGVTPRTSVVASAGIATSAGVEVDAFLQIGIPGIYAAGDIAAYPDPLTGEPVRVEHWVVAQRQGQAVAANMLGQAKPYRAVPFFWTEQYGVALRYVGRAAQWDEIVIVGTVDEGDFIARYYRSGTHCASASVGRDLELLEDERRLEDVVAQAQAILTH
ncbi:MAG: FAD-dependent oxidoreductase, partial [Sphingomicrobium sp.]